MAIKARTGAAGWQAGAKRFWPGPAMQGQVMREIDAIGLLCPLPVLRLARVLKGLAPGAMVRLLADDPMAVVDVPHFCAQSGHVLLAVQHTDRGQIYLIRRGLKRIPKSAKRFLE